MYVENEYLSMCCGQPSGECTCERPLHNGIGLPTPKFQQVQPKENETVVAVHNHAPEGGIGLPCYDFQQSNSESATPSAASGETPLGLPRWNW